MFLKTQKDTTPFSYNTHPQRRRTPARSGATLSPADLKRLVADMVD